MQNKRDILKKLENTRMLKNYGSWIYCNSCNKTVAYLCYTTYSYFKFDYNCQCGSNGSLEIGAKDDNTQKSKTNLILKKGRLCCSKDGSSLFTIVDKHIKTSNFQIICKSCGTEYSEKDI